MLDVSSIRFSQLMRIISVIRSSPKLKNLAPNWCFQLCVKLVHAEVSHVKPIDLCSYFISILYNFTIAFWMKTNIITVIIFLPFYHFHTFVLFRSTKLLTGLKMKSLLIRTFWQPLKLILSISQILLLQLVLLLIVWQHSY